MALGGHQWSWRHGLAAAGIGAGVAIVGWLQLLPGGPTSGQIGTGALTAKTGQAITVTRAGTKTCATSYSPLTWVTAANNTPCVEPYGLLLEGAATNKILQSQALGTTWTAGSGVVAAPTVTNNTTDVLDPFGGNNATKIVFPQVVGASAFSVVSQTFTGTTSGHTGYLYLRTLSGTATVYLNFNLAGASYKTATCTVTSSWSYPPCVVLNQALTAATWTFQVGTDLRDGAEATQPGQTVYAFAAQVEALPLPTSYIPTTTVAVTSVADNATLTNPLPSGAGAAWCLSSNVRSESGFLNDPGSIVRGVMGAGSFGTANSWGFYVAGGAPELRNFDNSSNFKGTFAGGANTEANPLVSVCNVAGSTTVWVDGSYNQTQTDSGGTGTGVITTQAGTIRLGDLSGGNPGYEWLTSVCIAKAANIPAVGTEPLTNVNNDCKQFTPCLSGSSCYLYTRPGTIKVDALGDSITLGSGVTYAWPFRMNAVLGGLGGGNYTVQNDGVAGNITAQMLSRWTDGGLDDAGFSYVTVLGGVNDALNGSVDAGTTISNLTAIYDDAHAHGVKVVALTVMPCGTYGPCNSTVQAHVSMVNAGIKAAQPSRAAWMKVFDTYALMGDPANPANLNPAYSLDLLHPNQAGNDAMALGVGNSIP